MPNPNEMHRLEVEARNEEYKKLEDSHNTLCTTASDVTRLVALKVKIKTGYLSKGTKSSLLAEIRAIEARLGIEGADYNSGEF